MAANDLAPGEVVDLPFTTWPRQWVNDQRESPSWIWVSNLSIDPSEELSDLDIRGPIGPLRTPIRAGDNLEISIWPVVDDLVDRARCELRLVWETLSERDAMHLQTAIVGICQAQKIDATDALCFFAQSYLMYRDWKYARKKQPGLLERQPVLPTDLQQSDELYGAYIEHGVLPLTSVSQLLEYWQALGGRLLGGFPGQRVGDGERPCYVRMPTRVLSPAGVQKVYGDAAVRSSPAKYEMRLSGNTWRVIFDGGETFCYTLKGLKYLAVLIENAGRTYRALELVQIVDEPGSGSEASALADNDLREADYMDSREEVGDKAYSDDMNQRLRQIVENELEIALDSGDTERIQELAEEAELIRVGRSQLKGKAGRSRNFSDSREKARKSVWSVLNTARKKFKDDIPALWKHLDKNLSTGVEFTYQADPEVKWEISWSNS
jgi:hypothetical protein